MEKETETTVTKDNTVSTDRTASAESTDNFLNYPLPYKDNPEVKRFNHGGSHIYAVVKVKKDGLEVLDTFWNSGQAILWIEEKDASNGEYSVLRYSVVGTYEAKGDSGA